MSQLSPGLEKGKYAYSSHSLFIAGNIVDVFTGVWKNAPCGKVLIKCPDDSDADGVERLCVIKLRKPMPLDDYRPSHHPRIRPLVKSPDSVVQAVLIPADMVCTFPDAL